MLRCQFSPYWLAMTFKMSETLRSNEWAYLNINSPYGDINAQFYVSKLQMYRAWFVNCTSMNLPDRYACIYTKWHVRWLTAAKDKKLVSPLNSRMLNKQPHKGITCSYRSKWEDFSVLTWGKFQVAPLREKGKVPNTVYGTFCVKQGKIHKCIYLWLTHNSTWRIKIWQHWWPPRREWVSEKQGWKMFQYAQFCVSPELLTQSMLLSIQK